MTYLKIYFSIFLSFPLISFAQNYSNIDYARHISEKDIKKNVEVLCSTPMQGRETGTKGQRKAAVYLYSQFKNARLNTIDKSQDSLSYFQKFDLKKLKLATGTIRVNKKIFHNYKDFVINSVQDSIIEELDVVFIGNEPLEAFSDIDLTNKAVLFLSSNVYKTLLHADEIWKHSKPKLILYNNPNNDKRFKRYIKTSKHFRNKRLQLNESYDQIDSILAAKKNNFNIHFKPHQIIPISARLTKTITGLKLKQLRNIKNKHTKIKRITNHMVLKANNKDENIATENVIAMLEGSEKPDEYILISAHYDHLGTHNGLIYHGANDNASGTAALVQIAKAFKLARQDNLIPKRSLIFVAFTGEEKGLLGSEYFVNNSPIPLKSIKANLNIDMIGRFDEKHKFADYVYLLGTSNLNPKLKPMSDSLNALHSHLKLNYEFNKPNSSLYYASDQASFISKEIPAIMYFNGIHKDYHTEKDTPNKLNYKNIERVSRLIFLTALELANQP